MKQGVWVLWLGSAAAALWGSGWVATIGVWVFGLTFVAHVVEFFVNLPLFRRAEGSLGHHFAQTMVYGIFHWGPIKERVASESTPPPGA